MKGFRTHRAVAMPVMVLLALALLVPATSGAGVPHKKYACYGEAGLYITYLQIKAHSKYTYLGASGKYSYHAAGKNLTFKSGPLKPWMGLYYKNGTAPAIDLTTHRHGGQTVDCSV